MNNDELKYRFGSLDGGEETGINDPVIMNFKGDISYHLAREAAQNVIDASDDGPDPPHIKFSLHHIDADELPRSNNLKSIFQNCLDYFNRNREYTDLFSPAIKKIEKNGSIPVLKISDYNTQGLTGGDYDRTGNYYKFFKGSGSTNKTGEAGGSYGLGKGAYFKASGFRMIFVSSIYGERNNFVFQGKLRIVTHEWNGERKQGNGSYGLKNQKPVRSLRKVPELFKSSEFLRNKKGTDIFIIDFKEAQKKWEKKIIEELLISYWLAFWKGRLTAEVGGKIINKDNLEQVLNSFFEDKNPTAENPLPYFRAYTENHRENTTVFEEQLPYLGKMKLSVMRKEGYPGKVCRVRNTGMVIERKERRVLPGPFAAVLICNGKAEESGVTGNELLRRMENPAHDEWSFKNIENNPKLRKRAKEAEKALDSFVKSSLRSLLVDDDNDVREITGMAKFLPNTRNKDEDFDNNEKGSAKGGFENPEESLDVRPSKNDKSKINTTSISRTLKGGRKSGSGEGDSKKASGGEEGGSGDGVRDPKSSGDENDSGDSIVEVEDLESRCFAQTNEDRIYHVIVLTGEFEKRVDLKLRLGTETRYHTPTIKHAEGMDDGTIYSVDENKIRDVDIQKNRRIKVYFETDERYSLNVTPYIHENR